MNKDRNQPDLAVSDTGKPWVTFSVDGSLTMRDEAFTEQLETDTNKRKGKRISLPLRDDRTIDWDRVRDTNKEAFVEAMEHDQHALDVLGLTKRAADTPAELEITEDHIKTFLGGLSWVEAMLVPKIIALKTKGEIKIPPALAFQVYQFSDEQKNKLAPPGATWANTSLPLWLKEWIARVGPGAEFFGGIALISIAQTQTLFVEYAKLQPPQQPKQPLNGKEVSAGAP